MLHGLRPLVVERTVGVPVEAQPEPGELVLELGEAVTEHDVGPRGFDERRPVLGVYAALPCHALCVAVERSGRLAVTVKRPVLVPDADVGVVEVRAVLRVCGVRDIDVVGPLVVIV